MTLQERINEAETALHELNLGKRVVKITRNGKSLEFNLTNVSDLRRYIADMKNQLGGTRRRPMSVSL